MNNVSENKKPFPSIFNRMSLARKFMISVGVISLLVLAADMYINMKQERALTIKTTRDWTLLLAEDVRTSLNMLMKEDKMDLRFALFESMKQELEGLKEVRVIRGPKVNEVLRRVRDELAIPREETAIKRYTARIAEFEGKLKGATDSDERTQWRQEIDALRNDIELSRQKIEKMRNFKYEVRPDEAIRDDLDRKVIETGKPLYQFIGDNGRVVIPYVTRKDCTNASGCHYFSKEGDVLGAISMSFSIEHLNQQMRRDNFTTAAFGVLKLAVVLIILLVFITIIVVNPLKKLKLGAQAIADGDLNHAIDIRTGDELQDLAENFNVMREKLYERRKLLSDSKKYVDNIIGSMTDMLIVLDPDDSITRVNRSASALLGYSEDELLGRPFKLVLQDEPLETGHLSSIKTERTYLAKDGRQIPVLFSASAMRDENNVFLGIVCVAQDISERKKAEMEIVRARYAAEESSRLKSEFLANISHEIRTPLTAVLGMTTLAMDSELTDVQRHYLQTSQKCANSLLDTINDILDFSKIEAGKLSLDPADFNLHRIVDGIADTLSAGAYAKGLELAFLVDYKVPALLKGDSGRIRQILLNLGSNAIKFTSTGEVVIRAELIEETDKEVTVLFSVTDTGIGIPEEKQESIFQPFVQADGSTTRKYGGTGLGLSISRELVSMMNGEIGVESEPGKGSRFWFTVAFEKQKESGEETSASAHDIKGMRVLIADDNEATRIVLLKMLEGFGCIASVVGSGNEAVDVLRETAGSPNPFRLVLLDMQMPGMDGEQTLAAIKHTPAISWIPVVILTSLGNRGDVSRLREHGCAAYLIKPVRQSLLYDAITAVMDMGPKSGDVRPSSVVTRHSIAEEKLRKIDILLVDDNPVKQKIMATMLKKAGLRVDTLSNGFLAVQAVGDKKYDLIFLELQMSIMSGIETAKRIREKEKGRGHHTIIAMTQDFSQDARERCIKAGMNDCIPEPVNPPELFGVIEKWTDVEGLSHVIQVNHPVSAREEADLNEHPVDFYAAMHRFGNDRAFYREMLGEFLDYLPEKLERLSEAIDSGSGQRMEKHACDIKSAAASLSAGGIFSIARTIEQMGREKITADAVPLLDGLKQEFERLKEFAATWK